MQKALKILEACVSVNSNLYGKISLIVGIFSQFGWKIQSHFGIFFIPDLNFFSCELENFTFKVLYLVVILKQNKVIISSWFVFYFYASSIRKKIIEPPAWS